jgi:DNA-binding response OmpR family regulator
MTNDLIAPVSSSHSSKNAIPFPDFGYLNFRLPVSQILIVEDDTSTLQLIKAAAREAYELIRVVSFSSADDALWYLEYLKRNRQPGPELAVVDIFLKGERDGFSVCKFISEDFPETTIVVASSMHPETFQEKSEALPNKPNFMMKPFQLRELVRFFRNFRGVSFSGK